MPWTVKQSFAGSPDGNTVHRFNEGEEISPSDARMSESLWSVAVREGWIEQSKAAPSNKARLKPRNK